MKTSNKILIITFLLSVSLIYALPVAVNVKYAKKDFVITNDDSKRTYSKLAPGKIVLLSHIKNCIIVPSDSFRIGLPSDKQKSIRYNNEGDSLIVESSPMPDPLTIVVYLPLASVDKIIFDRSSGEIKGGLNYNIAPSYSVDLRKSRLSLNNSDDLQFFDRVSINAYDSSASLIIPKRNHINKLLLLNLSKTNISSSTNVDVFQGNFNPRAVVKVLKNEKGIEIISKP